MESKIIYVAAAVLFLIAVYASVASSANCNSDSDCKNSGICDDDNGTAPCNCTPSMYHGDTCQDVCENNSHCKNNGTCNTAASPKVCNCTSGYETTFCDAKSSSDVLIWNLNLILLAIIICEICRTQIRT